ncbi:TRAP transporter small permease [Alteribacillus sp. JSM 102045]|uniref:TRAP transporter small permease n=1 Tax=Alteribacillus sp. JSM 102045 TaxID=1562101 RepID=UPI0035C03B16
MVHPIILFYETNIKSIKGGGLKILTKIENAFAALFFLVGIGISLYSVFMRYVVGQSQSWATEIFTMMLVWAIFIGFSTALRDDSHIAIDILYDRVPAAVQKLFEIITVLAGIGFSIFFIVAGIDMTSTAYNQGINTIDVGFPIWINYLIMPISGVLLLIRFIEKGVKIFVNNKQSENEEGA